MAENQNRRKNPIGRREQDKQALHELVEQRRNDRLRWAAPYVFIVIIAALGFLRTDTAIDRANDAIDRVDQEALARDYAQCGSSNEARQGIRDFITAIVLQDGTISEGEQRALDLANETFAPLTCPPRPSFLEPEE